MTVFTLYEYKKDGLYNSFADSCLFMQSFSTLPECCNFLVGKYPDAELVANGSVGWHYLNIIETENNIVQSNRGFYRLNFVTD